MTKRQDTDGATDRQTARFQARFGRRGAVSGSLRVTDRGLLAIAVLVSGILLSTAVLVRVSIREGAKARSS